MCDLPVSDSKHHADRPSWYPTNQETSQLAKPAKQPTIQPVEGVQGPYVLRELSGRDSHGVFVKLLAAWLVGCLAGCLADCWLLGCMLVMLLID